MPVGSPFGGDNERIAQELRLQQRDYLEEVEAAVAEAEAAATTLEERLLQLGNRSVDLSIEVGEAQFRGCVVHTSGEVVTVRSPNDEKVAIVIGHIDSVRFGLDPGAPAAVDRGDPQTLLAYLRQLWTLEQPCTLGRSGRVPLAGTLIAVSEGHVELQDPIGSRWLLPTRTITWVAVAQGIRGTA